MKAYYNGTFGDFDDIRIPLSDRCIYFGDGVYDAMIGYKGRIDRLDEHLDRFMNNISILGLNITYKKEELSNLISLTVQSSGYESYFIYVQATRDGGERSHVWDDGAKTNLLITLKPYTLPSPDRTLKLTLTNDLRYGMCNVKTLNLLPNVLAATKAARDGFDEAIFLKDGFVTECSHSNISIIKDGTLITHPDSPRILPGITKKHLLADAKSIGIPVEERPFAQSELFAADSVIVSSTSMLLCESKIIDKKCFDVGKNEISSLLIRKTYKDYLNRMGIL